jgi:phage FluMu protein Com
MSNYFDFRCKQCNKLLGRVSGNAEIACPRCGGLNRISFDSKSITYLPKAKKSETSHGQSEKARLERIAKRDSSGVTFR